jgi:hypothetical protein
MESEQLQPQLVEAQNALQGALDEACDADLTEADTGELIRIEEALSVASKAAKEVVSVRLRRRGREGGGVGGVGGGGGGGGGGPATKRSSTQGDTAEAEPAAITHRVFDDIRGRRWHAFAVRASDEMTERAGLPESFRQGWLVFESGDELRRVAPIPENWEEFSTEELRLRCHNAVGARRRTRSTEPPEDTENPVKS